MWLFTPPVAFPRVFFFCISIKYVLLLQSLVKPMTRYLWSWIFPCYSGSRQVRSWLVGLLCWLALIPSPVQPLQLWYALWASHWVLVPEIHRWGPLRFRYLYLGTIKVLQRKVSWNLHPQAQEVLSIWNNAVQTPDPCLQVSPSLAAVFSQWIKTHR